jgi:K+-sensing histidine kinase KdpD
MMNAMDGANAVNGVGAAPGDGTVRAGGGPGAPTAGRTARRLARLLAVAVPPALAAALVPFRATFPAADGALAMVVVIVAVAVFGDRLAGVVGAVSAGLWYDFFLTRPYERFAISARGDIETTVLLLLVGVAVTELTVRGRRHHRQAVEGSAYLAQLQSVARMMAEGTDARAVTSWVEGALTDLLHLRGCYFDPQPAAATKAVITQGGDVVLAGLTWGWLPGRRVDLPVQFGGKSYGTFVLVPTPGVPVSQERRMVASVLADEVGAVLAGSGREPR